MEIFEIRQTSPIERKTVQGFNTSQEKGVLIDEAQISNEEPGEQLNSSADDILNKLMNQTFNINILGQKIPFDVRDEIFQLSVPVQPRCLQEKDNTILNCGCCRREMGPRRKIVSSQCCEFCGQLACQNCMWKQRLFQCDLRSNLNVVALRTSQDSESPGQRSPTSASPASHAMGFKNGRICVFCDRKFILYEYYSEFACQVEENDMLIKEAQTEMKQKDRDFRVLKKDTIKIKKDIEKQAAQEKFIEESAIDHEFQIEKRKEDLLASKEQIIGNIRERKYDLEQLKAETTLIRSELKQLSQVTRDMDIKRGKKALDQRERHLERAKEIANEAERQQTIALSQKEKQSQLMPLIRVTQDSRMSTTKQRLGDRDTTIKQQVLSHSKAVASKAKGDKLQPQYVYTEVPSPRETEELSNSMIKGQDNIGASNDVNEHFSSSILMKQHDPRHYRQSPIDNKMVSKKRQQQGGGKMCCSTGGSTSDDKNGCIIM